MLIKEISPNIIFLGLNLQVLEGLNFLKDLKHEEGLKEIPIVVFSISANPKIVQEIRDLGIRQFFVKPSKYSDLKNLILPILSSVNTLQIEQ